jgi:hypothetical protein
MLVSKSSSKESIVVLALSKNRPTLMVDYQRQSTANMVIARRHEMMMKTKTQSAAFQFVACFGFYGRHKKLRAKHSASRHMSFLPTCHRNDDDEVEESHNSQVTNEGSSSSMPRGANAFGSA